MALSATPDWRWRSGREDNPWYPAMRIFRQQKFMDWAPVFDRIAVELRKRVPATVRTPSVAIETAAGELIDKITILEIKSERISDGDKVRNVLRELDTLRKARDRTIRTSDELDAMTAELRSVNEALWHIEDEIRLCEREGDFGPRFVETARSMYHKNDERAAINRRINILLGSTIIEEKSYSSDLVLAAGAQEAASRRRSVKVLGRGPLTPALSHRERAGVSGEPVWPDRTGWRATRYWLPLPMGEGWGEGRALPRSFASSIARRAFSLSEFFS